MEKIQTDPGNHPTSQSRRQRPLRAATRSKPAAATVVLEPEEEGIAPDSAIDDFLAQGEGDFGPDEADEGAEPAPLPARAPGRHPARLHVSNLAKLGLAVLVAALVFAIVELNVQHSRADHLQTLDSLRSSAAKTATVYGAYLSSYNYQNLTGSTSAWGEVDSHSTASFRKSFDSTKSQLESVITDYKASAAGKVTAAAVESVSSSHAVVLLFVDQTVTNSTQKSGAQTQPFRVALTMLRQHGQWLIDSVQTS